MDPPDSYAWDFSSGTGAATARQNVAGIGAVSSQGSFADGESSAHVLFARTTWSESATNSNLAPQAYDIQLLIKPARLALSDFVGLSATSPDAIVARYRVSLLLDGVEVFGSTAEMRGGRVSHTLTETGTGLGGTAFVDATFPNNILGYDFDAFAATIALGTFAPGASLTATYIMEAEVRAPGFETGGLAFIADPFSLDGSGAIVRLVPEPGTLVLVALGLAALGRRGGIRRDPTFTVR